MKSKLLPASLLLCLTLSACNAGGQSPDTATAATPAKPSTTHAPIAATPACPSQDFDQFLTAFASDVEVQKAHVAIPLESETVDANAEPEPRPVVKRLALADLKFPLLPSPQQQARERLELAKTITDAKHIEIKLAKPDTDYQMVYLFQNDGCWKLSRMRDDSL